MCIRDRGILNSHQRARALEGASLDVLIIADSHHICDELYATKARYEDELTTNGTANAASDVYRFLQLIQSLHETDVGGKNKNFFRN